ncbi:unnamed protein product [Didymodactylos carnosus]|uniref:Uncharacterized protein n=1 Tax=Didymodactylos carnosus TaxID=1234261 RepID=A0A816BTB8_9BILA|nr:unnamed protein product [Didymodactylos carnosus]CAF1613859.1 unnamed protein product [Didymodactylos carnosus]CAF4359459.1 unnamed protein product [Didymodactylos carnosus]CAF4499067.1 unnamed protein product [Didymodactylos carnosus]
MPLPAKRAAQCRNLLTKRYASDNRSKSGIGLSDDDSYMEEKPEPEKEPSNFTEKICLDDLAALFDLCKSRAKFKDNGARPYFEGHERPDALESRKDFVDYSLTRESNFYTVSDGDKPFWMLPQPFVGPKSILTFHDESTFRSGEIAPKRWFYGEDAPFYSKGKGRSNVISDFAIAHASGPFFILDQQEYQRAVRKYPELDMVSGVDYVERTVTASINIGYDAYFDNDTILGQFERLFKMLEFKEDFKDYAIYLIVDNARTHTKKSHNLLDFRKNIGKKCPVDRIEYLD